MTRARLTTLKSKYIYNIYIHQITVIVGSNQIVVSSPPDRNTAQFDPTMTKKSLTYSRFKLERHYQHVFTMFNNELWQAQSWGERCPSAQWALSWTEPHPYSLSFVAWFCLGNPKRYRRAVMLTHGGKSLREVAPGAPSTIQFSWKMVWTTRDQPLLEVPCVSNSSKGELFTHIT